MKEGEEEEDAPPAAVKKEEGVSEEEEVGSTPPASTSAVAPTAAGQVCLLRFHPTAQPPSCPTSRRAHRACLDAS